MRLKRLIVENFRGYREPTSVSFAEFTSIIGKNDVGKSTLLEALDIFFNDKAPDGDDCNVRAKGAPTRISCEFGSLPSSIVIDSHVSTTLAGESASPRDPGYA
jgi:putative ATP-dependent endonuclease of OLD family